MCMTLWSLNAVEHREPVVMPGREHHVAHAGRAPDADAGIERWRERCGERADSSAYRLAVAAEHPARHRPRDFSPAARGSQWMNIPNRAVEPAGPHATRRTPVMPPSRRKSAPVNVVSSARYTDRGRDLVAGPPCASERLAPPEASSATGIGQRFADPRLETVPSAQLTDPAEPSTAIAPRERASLSTPSIPADRRGRPTPRPNRC